MRSPELGARYTAARDLAKAALTVAARAVWPPNCPICREEVLSDGGLCPSCWRDLSFITGAACETCAMPLPGEADEGAQCDACLRLPPAWSRGRAALVYEGAGKDLILAFKHGDRLDIAPMAGAWMRRAAGDLPADLIAPVPLHWTRLAKRRFNQAAELSRAVARAYGRREAFHPAALYRSSRTPSMDGKGREARRENAAGAFAATPHGARAMRGKAVLLIDDVLTTGATLSACAEACRAAGAADVNVLTLARVARGDGAA